MRIKQRRIIDNWGPADKDRIFRAVIFKIRFDAQGQYVPAIFEPGLQSDDSPWLRHMGFRFWVLDLQFNGSGFGAPALN